MKIRTCSCNADFEAVFPVILELRPGLTFDDYSSLIAEAKKRDEYEIVAIFEGPKCIAAMGFRILFDFVHGKHLYIDDLVVSEDHRSKGIGHELLNYAEIVAAEKKCRGLRLCTGIDRKGSQRFYERNNWRPKAIAYKKQLEDK
jgi:GNAT superfamily N-acetyltransferase